MNSTFFEQNFPKVIRLNIPPARERTYQLRKMYLNCESEKMASSCRSMQHIACSFNCKKQRRYLPTKVYCVPPKPLYQIFEEHLRRLLSFNASGHFESKIVRPYKLHTERTISKRITEIEDLVKRNTWITISIYRVPDNSIALGGHFFPNVRVRKPLLMPDWLHSLYEDTESLVEDHKYVMYQMQDSS